MTPNHAVRQLTRSGIALAQHPLAAAAYAAGLVKGTVRATGTVVDNLVHPQRRPPAAETVGEMATEDLGQPATDTAEDTGPDDTAPAPVTGERTLFGGLNKEAAPPMMPGGGGEAVEHEPHAESRDVAHGAAAQPREVDSWQEEALDAEVETPVGTTGADLGFNPDTSEGDLDQPGTEPVLDEAVAKAVRSEAETLRKAADPDKG